MVSNSTFSNILVISRWSFFFWWRKPEYLEKITQFYKIWKKLLVLHHKGFNLIFVRREKIFSDSGEKHALALKVKWSVPQWGLGLWCWMPLSKIFQLHVYRGGQFYWWRKPDYPEKITKPVTSLWQTLYNDTCCIERGSNSHR